MLTRMSAQLKIFVFVLLFVFVHRQVTIAKQETWLRKEAVRTINFEIDGAVRTNSHYKIVVELFEGQEILRLESVQRELEIVDFQKKELNKVFEDVGRESRRLIPGMANAEMRRVKGNAEIAKIRSEIDGILLAHQKQRLVELVERLEIRKLGMLNYLREFSTENEFDFHAKKLKKIIKDAKENVLSELKTFAKTQILDMLAILDESQKNAFMQVVGDFDALSLEWVYLDLTNFEQQRDSLTNNDDPTVFELVGSFCRFKTLADGTWTRENYENVPTENLAKLLAQSLVRDPVVLEQLGLSAEQIERLELLLGNDIEEQIASRNEFDAKRKNSISAAETRRLELEYRNVKIERQKKFHDDFLLVMPDRAFDPIKKRLARLSIVSNGSFSQLVYNAGLRKKIGVTDKQVRQLKSLASQKAEVIRKKLLEAENRILESIFDSFKNEELRLAIKEAIGDHPTFLEPSLSFFDE